MSAAAPLAILHVVAPAHVGGLERVVLALAAGHVRLGHRVSLAAVVTPGAPESLLVSGAREAGVAVHLIPVPGRAYLRERAAVRALCRSGRSDVVHTHGYRPDVVDGGVARRVGLPVVSTVHGFTGGDWKNRAYERLQVRAYRRFAAVVAVSRVQVGQLVASGLRPERVHLIPNAWMGGGAARDRAAARRALGLPAEGVVVGWVGRLSPEKGPDVLVRALATPGAPQVRVAVVGGGKMGAAVRAEAVQLGVADRIVWTGPVPGAAALLPAFDLLVLSSRTEGTPIVLFEAMAAGIPVVATRVGGVPDVVGEDGALLVPPGDPAALAAALDACLADPEAAAARVAAARQRLSAAYALDPWLRRYEDLYQGVRRPANGAERSPTA
jgi:glycosyltransferase involved in cell wall biosynthesis